ncbi:sensor domain-containing diguanylate cyclase [Paenibacillus tengchongensis]|uniref:sensor domain-containing diguanylate cyclase n=1 Tax=Paenibacillus tengchongensis TaxID=2608684 RepID=UPI00124CE59B|nr:sensor domain-containing diguanylate cyclase [Paenibacillus tengchongensis]
MSLNLRTLLSGASALIIVLLTALLIHVIGEQSTDRVEVSIGGSLAKEAYQMAEKLDHFMWARSGEVEVLSKLSAFQQPYDPAEIGGLLNQLKSSLPVFTWVGFLDTQGNVISATGNILAGQNISQRPVFQEGLKGLYTGDVHDAVLLAKLLPNPSGEPLQFVDVSVPVQGKDGQVSGVLAAHLSWEWSREVESSILAPLKDRMRELEIYVVSRRDDTILLGPSSMIGRKLSDDVLAKARAGENSWVVEKNGADKKYLTGYAYGDGYMNYPGLGWTVVVRQPAEIAFAPVHQLERFMVLSGLAAAVVFGILGWLLAGWIARPLHRLSQSANMLSSGTQVEIPVNSRIKDVAVLASSLNNLVGNLTKTENKLSFMSDIALHDGLTGLLNRTGLNEFLAHAVGKAKQNRTTLSFLYLDLDGFKNVNDSLGHAAGDALLKKVADRLVDCTRENEIVARIGGDEFVVVLNTTAGKPAYEAEVVAARIISKINLPIEIGDATAHVGCSVGAAVWTPDGLEPEEILHLADEALYISKRSGKNRITFEAAS